MPKLTKLLSAYECLLKIEPLIAVSKKDTRYIEKQMKLRSTLDQLVLGAKIDKKVLDRKSPNKKSYFADQMLPFFTHEELENSLSDAEKKIAQRSEHSGLDEAADSYHQSHSNPSKR